MKLLYLWSKFIKKLPSSAIRNSLFEKPSKVEARSTIIDSSFGRYTYCGYHCCIINSSIGRYTSIADNVSIGQTDHPLDWVSTSPAFYKGKDSIPKNLAKLSYCCKDKKTVIGNDVWIGYGAIIRQGTIIGNGAVVGAGTVVTKDVPPYSIVVGNPSRIVRKRFDDETIVRLVNSGWWELEPDKLKKYSEYMNEPERFIDSIKKDLKG